MAIVAVSIAPLGTNSPSVSEYVAAAEAILREEPRLKYELGAMFTTIEGDLGLIFATIQRMQEAIFAMGAQRVSTVIKVDERRDKQASAADKVRAVVEKRRS